VAQVLGRGVERLNPAIDDDGQIGPILLEPVHTLVVQRRDLAVGLGREPLQPRLARVHDQRIRARGDDGVGEALQERVAVAVVDADARLHRHRHIDRCLHPVDTRGHCLGLGHQTSAEGPRSDAVAGAAHVDVDLVIAPRRTESSRLGHHLGLAATDLQRHRMLERIEREQALGIAAKQRLRGDHLGVQQRAPGYQAHQVPLVPVGAVHHGRHAERAIERHHLSPPASDGTSYPISSEWGGIDADETTNERE
jgi:hypothetical protein